MRGKTGVYLIGALGSIATTVVTGALALRERLIPPVGMVTATNVFEGVDLVRIEDLEFGGCDIRSATDEPQGSSDSDAGPIDPRIAEAVGPELRAIRKGIHGGTATNCGEAIAGLAGGTQQDGKTLRDEIEEIRERLRRFKRLSRLDEVIVVNLASTEPPLEYEVCHEFPAALEACLDANRAEKVRASTLYAYAAIREGCPYVNFTPSNAALFPALVSLAEQCGVPVMGSDGKTGETLVKSALAPMFACRNLEVLSWEGYNILGNMDGRVLDHPQNRESKIRSKDRVLSKILGYAPHSRTGIDYVPSLDDQKTAWDFIHFRGFLGAKMSLQFTWQGYDSILAAPLVLDMVRLAEFALRRGEAGLMPHLALFFKTPLGVEEYSLEAQYRMLLDYASGVRTVPRPVTGP